MSWLQQFNITLVCRLPIVALFDVTIRVISLMIVVMVLRGMVSAGGDWSRGEGSLLKSAGVMAGWGFEGESVRVG